MANYGFISTDTPPSGARQIAIATPASGFRRVKLYEMMFGVEGTPADVTDAFGVTRTTTAFTGGSAITPTPLDPADPACVTLAYNTPTGGGTNAAAVWIFALNQKATFRWIAAPGSEIVIPAAASQGVTMGGIVVNATVVCTLGCSFQET